MKKYQIGKNIMLFRKEKGMSIREFAAFSGVSSSLICQLEKGNANPSLVVLELLAKALDVPLYSLFIEDTDPESLISRKSERKNIYVKNNTQILYDILTPDFMKSHLEMLIMYLKANSSTTQKHFIHREKEELAIIMEGKVYVELDKNEYLLEKGDLVRIPPNVKHRFINKTNKKVTVLFVLIPALSSK